MWHWSLGHLHEAIGTKPFCKALLAIWLGDDLVVEARVPPRRNNYLIGYRR